ncbi:MAG: GGDEF domain-containing protein [Thermoanaerobaculia bacterium]
MNPVGYLLISMCFTSSVLAVVFWIAWRTFGREAHALTWSITFAVVTLQRVLNLGKGWFPDPASYWIVVNAIGVAAVTLALVGHLQRTGRPTRIGALSTLGAIVCLAVAWFTVVQPHVGLQMAIQPLEAGVLVCWMGVIVYRFRPRPTAAEVAAAVAHVVFGLTQLLAGVVALLQGPASDPALLDLYLKINFLLMPGAFVAMGVFVVFILASDLAEHTRQLAGTDPLTGLLNRRGFREAALRAVAQALRARRPLAVVLADIDRFKTINDEWGHAAGDEALQAFAAKLRRGRRVTDLVARIGGEEFVLLLPHAGAEEAVAIAERIRVDLSDEGLRVGDRQIPLTASFGVAALGEGVQQLDDLLREADDALYRAKESGRDRVVAAGLPQPLSESTGTVGR